MNRDQWTLKMKQEEERALQTGSALGGSGRKSIFDRRAGSPDRRAAQVDRRRGPGSRQSLSGKGNVALSLVEKYGACCEWSLSTGTRKR